MRKNNSNLLNEVLGDVKAVRETAIQAAMSRLQETFEPTVRSLISQKISEEGEEFEDDMPELEDDFEGEGDVDVDIDDILRELEAEDDEYSEEDEFSDEPAPEAPAPTPEPAPDVDAAPAPTPEPAPEPSFDDELDFEEDELDEIIAELEGELDDEIIDEDANDYDDESETGLTNAHSGLNETRRLKRDNQKLKSKLNEVNKAMIAQKNVIKEVNLLNSKLLFLTKITNSYNMSKSQQMKVLEAFDRAKNVREVKLIYATISESLGANSAKSSKKTIKESVGSASKRSRAINENASKNGMYEFAPRWQKIAGMNK